MGNKNRPNPDCVALAPEDCGSCDHGETVLFLFGGNVEAVPHRAALACAEVLYAMTFGYYYLHVLGHACGRCPNIFCISNKVPREVRERLDNTLTGL